MKKRSSAAASISTPNIKIARTFLKLRRIRKLVEGNSRRVQRGELRSGRTLPAVSASSWQAEPGDVSGLFSIRQQLPRATATRLEGLGILLPWAFFSLAGALEVAWAIALCWAALALVRWLVG